MVGAGVSTHRRHSHFQRYLQLLQKLAARRTQHRRQGFRGLGFARFLRIGRSGQQLERYRAVEPSVFRPVDRPHPPAVDLPEVPDTLSVRINGVLKGLNENTVNDSQRVIANFLRELGLSCDLEVPPMSGAALGQMLAIDVACKEHKIAIEYDGQYHFLKEVGTGKVTYSENGRMKAKRRF